MSTTTGPKSITLVRHGQSAYNVLREQKDNDVDYKKFVQSYERSFTSRRTRDLAKLIQEKYKAPWGDHNTPLTEEGARQARVTAECLSEHIPCPDVVFVSPYLRTRTTLEEMRKAWEELKQVETLEENLLREQSYGIGILYNDWRVFQALNPDQKRLRDINGPYWYKYPQGETVADTKEHAERFHDKIVTVCDGKNVLVVSHHRFILTYVAALRGLAPEEVLELDETSKPQECGVTYFEENSKELVLQFYNQKLWE